MTDALVTVLMPVRNASPYIVEAVASIQSQTEHRFRLWVMDDGSTDDGLDKIATLKDERVSIFPDRCELGIAQRLNWGIDHSTTRFVARMDADDIAEPDRLARQVEFMRRRPEVAISGTGYRIFSDDKLSGPIVLPTEHEALKAMTLFASPFAHPTVIFNRAHINRANLRYSADFPHAEDYELWERAADVVRLGNIPEALLRYRVHPLQVSSKHTEIQRATSDAIRRRALQRLDLAFSEAEFKLHCDCGSGAIAGDDARLTAAKHWFRELAARAGSRHPAVAKECRRMEWQLDGPFRDRIRRNVWWRRLLRRVRGRST